MTIRSESDRRYFYTEIGDSYFGSSSFNLIDPSLTAGKLTLHLLLFLLTIVTTTLSGAIFPYFLQDADLGTLFYALFDRASLAQGLLFSFTLLTILGMHELGHYITCRYYNIRATLPYFIPVPPPFGIGTLGAFIKIQSPIQTRKALFDVGVSGPLAGFVFALPAAIVGIYFSQPQTEHLPISFTNPLLFTLIAKLLGRAPEVEWNPVWFACWIGMLATALNLLPVGQLDGGHVVYSLFGKRGHKYVAIAIMLLQASIAWFGYKFYNWSGGFIYAGMLLLMFLLRHPPILDEHTSLGSGRKVLAVVALLIFLLSFMPMPIRID